MAVRITRAGVGLTVGIIVLALVAVGALYIARERGEQARRDDAVQVAQEEPENETGVLSPSPEENNQQSGENDGQSNGDQAENDTETMPDTGTQSTPEQLPATGPADTAAQLFIVAVLAYAGASYITSRRTAKQ